MKIIHRIFKVTFYSYILFSIIMISLFQFNYFNNKDRIVDYVGSIELLICDVILIILFFGLMRSKQNIMITIFKAIMILTIFFLVYHFVGYGNW